MRILLPYFTALLLIALPLTAQAQDYKTLLDIPEGATLVNLSATESIEIEQDLLIATLQYQAEDKDAKIVQNEVNSAMQKALDEAQKVDSIKVTTQQYYVHQFDANPSRDAARRNMMWRGQQSLQIKGMAADDLLELAGELQDLGLTMNGLSYNVSPELLEKTRNGLLEVALGKLTEKANRTAKAIGKDDVEFLQINVDMGGNDYNPRVMRSMAMDAPMAKMEMAAPVAAPGESTMNLTVSAQALLR